MVAGAGGDDAAGSLLRRQMRNFVVGATQLEAEHRLEILTLEEHRISEATREAWGRIERRLTCHVIDAAREDVVEKRGERRIQSEEYIVRIVRVVRVVLVVRGSNVLPTRAVIRRAAVNSECGVATTRTRPAAIASQIAAGCGSASTSE